MAHLRSFLRAHGRDNELAAPQATYYHRQQSFFLAIQSGARPGATAMAGLLTSLMRERFRIRPKLAMTAFFILGFLLPNDRARALLAYRLSTGPRSLARALRAVRAVS